jgi:Tol biopolymer transport system component
MKKLLFAILILIWGISHAQTFGKNKVNASPQEFTELKTLHFDIYYPRGEDDFGKTVALMAEEIYYYLKDDLKYPVLSRIPIIFYSTKSEFQVTNIIYPLLSEGVGGFTESLRNRVVVPFDGSYSNLEKLLAHELTHAYINALDNRVTNAVQALRPSMIPFWFTEGLPEFLAIGGEDDHNNMFILDMVVNDNLPSLEYIGGYLAYRLGESFLTWIAEVYGREKVSEYFYSLRTMNRLDDATKRVFGISFEELESRWRYQLKRDYFPSINSHDVPKEVFQARTDHRKDGSYFNFSPRFSPDGSRYVYFSSAKARFSIWMGGTHGISKPRRVITGEANGKMEEFYYMRSSLSWFPDGKRVVFGAKTSLGDRIHILNVDSGKIEETIRIDELDAIFEMDLSPDGRYLALSAQKGLRTDIFVYDLDTRELTQLTNDSFYDAQPRFSADGKRIAFASERDENPDSHRYGYFANITFDIFEYRLDDHSLWQITRESFDCTQPIYVGDTNLLAFVSTRDGIQNYELIDLENNRIAPLTSVLAGTFNGDISRDTNYILLSNYFDGAWNIYFDTNPIRELRYQDYPAPEPFALEYDLLDRLDFERLNRYGPRDRKVKIKSGYQEPVRRPVLSGYEPVIPDTNLIAGNFAWDERPSEDTHNPPPMRKYRPKFALDTFWGGMAYSSSYGAVGTVELGLSDLMGDHGIGLSFGISDKLKETNFVFTYLYLKQRADWGASLFNLYDEAYYRLYQPTGNDYLRTRQRQTGAYFLARYPFSRFSRVELHNMLYDYHIQWDYLPNSNINSGQWINDIESSSGLAYAPGLSLVYDNALFGATGPMLGYRAEYTMRKSFAKDDMDYLTNYIDLRSYTLFSRRYSLALRANGGISTGSSPDRFTLGGYHGIRALSYNLAGSKKALASMELRFPMLDYMAMAFPLPLVLSGIRGSAYVDVGAVWDDTDKFRGAINGRLEDVKLGYGFGPRFNLGYFVLKLDLAWLTDLSRISKPQIYLSLSEDF